MAITTPIRPCVAIGMSTMRLPKGTMIHTIAMRFFVAHTDDCD